MTGDDPLTAQLPGCDVTDRDFALHVVQISHFNLFSPVKCLPFWPNNNSVRQQ